MTTNERVKQLREALGQSQEQFGASIGISKSGISNIENGLRKVTEKHIKLICMIYKINEDWLRNGKGKMDIKSNDFCLDQFAKERGASELELSIAKAYFELPQDIRSDILIKLQKFVANNKPNISNHNITKQTASQSVTAIPEPSTNQQSEIAELRCQIQELARQNQNLTAKVEAMEKEDELLNACDYSNAG